MPLWRVVWSELRIGVFETEAKDATEARYNWQAAKENDRGLGRREVSIHRVERVHPPSDERAVGRCPICGLKVEVDSAVPGARESVEAALRTALENHAKTHAGGRE